MKFLSGFYILFLQYQLSWHAFIFQKVSNNLLSIFIFYISFLQYQSFYIAQKYINKYKIYYTFKPK